MKKGSFRPQERERKGLKQTYLVELNSRVLTMAAMV